MGSSISIASVVALESVVFALSSMVMPEMETFLTRAISSVKKDTEHIESRLLCQLKTIRLNKQMKNCCNVRANLLLVG